MKSFNNSMAIIFLCAAGFVFAKQTASRIQTTPTKKTSPTKQSQPTIQATTQVKTYKDLLEEIKNKMQPATVWDSANKRLKDQFVASIVKSAQDANLTFIECEALLQAARNFHVPFTNNNAQNSLILTNINNQITTIKKYFVEPTMSAAPTPITQPKPIASKKPLLPQPESTAPKASIAEPKSTNTKTTLLEPMAQQPAVTTVPEQPQLPFSRSITELQEHRELNKSEEQPEPHYTESTVQGIFALEMFKKSSPKTFGNTLYVNGELNKNWLIQALETVLNNVSLTERNRMVIQEELSKNATEMIKEIIQNDKKITPEQLQKKLNDVHNQVVRFINEQLTKGRPYYAEASKGKQVITTVLEQKPVMQRVKLKSQELAQAKLITLPSWVIKKNDQNYSIDCPSFGHKVLDYINENIDNPNIKTKNGNFDTTFILSHFNKQLPSIIPNAAVIFIMKQMKTCIDEITAD